MLRYLHSMIRVDDLDETMKFYTEVMGMVEVRRMEFDDFRFTCVFLAAPHDIEAARSDKFAPTLELQYYWDEEARRKHNTGRKFGHLAYRVDDIYGFCDELKRRGITINRPPRNGLFAIFTTPDGVAVEIVQQGGKLPPKEPWASMPMSEDTD